MDVEQVFARNPAVLLSFFPRCAILSHTNDNVETVISKVEALTVTLGAVTDEGKGVVLEVILPMVRLTAAVEADT